jgi:predicted MFS family arabinose efflux permease
MFDILKTNKLSAFFAALIFMLFGFATYKGQSIGNRLSEQRVKPNLAYGATRHK